MEKKNNNFIIIILIAIILGLSGFIIYDKVLRKDNNTPVNSESNSDIKENTPNDNQDSPTTLKVLVDYFADPNINILEAKAHRIKSKDLGDTEDFEKEINLSKEQLIELLNCFSDLYLNKIYLTGTGFGYICNSIRITYEINEKKYLFEIEEGDMLSSEIDTNSGNVLDNTDTNLISVLDKAVIKEIRYKASYVFPVYEIDKDDFIKAFDKYFHTIE